MSKGKELAIVENFELAINGEVAEMMAEELEGLGEIPFDRVKIPSGGGAAFEVPGDDPDSPDIAKEIIGIIVDHHSVNAYWEKEYDGEKVLPDCSSLDGKTGIEVETGEIHACEHCPFNEFGSGKDNQGKACKNMHRIYILQSGDIVPIILTLPPTSIKNFRDYIGKRVVVKGLRTHHVITKITLKKETNAKGILYSSAQFALVGKISDEQAGVVNVYKTGAMKNTRNMGISDDDYIATEALPKPTEPEQNIDDAETDDFVVDTDPTFEDAETKE